MLTGVVLPVVSHVVHPQVMWTGLPCENFHLLVCCAILDSEKQKIMEENYGFNEILKVSIAPKLPGDLCTPEIVHRPVCFSTSTSSP